jgi:hypothetical protein
MVPKDIDRILSYPKPKGEDLAALVSRSFKEKQKYDKYLSDDLMNFEYANTWLDVDKAWDELKKLKTSIVLERSDDITKESDNKVMTKYDFRHIKDISNVIKYDTFSDPLNIYFSVYLKDSGLDCEIKENATPPNAPTHAMPINFLLQKGNKRIAVLLLSKSKIKRYSVLETEALCRENGITVLKFYFECTNEKEYVIDRIRNAFN